MALEILGRLLHRGVPLSRYRMDSIKELRFDCSLAKRELGWEPGLGERKGLDPCDRSQASLVP